MNALTKVTASVPALTSGAPRYSAELDRAFDQALRPIEGVSRDPVSLEVCEEADRHLSYIDRTMRTVGPDTVMDWLRPISAAVRNPPGPEDFAIKAAAIAAACREIPARYFDDASQFEALGKFQFFPAAADVVGLFKQRMASLNAKRRALRMVADAKPSEVSDEPTGKALSDGARDAIVSAFFKKFDAAMAPAASAPATPGRLATKPAYLSRDQLLLIYQRDAKGGGEYAVACQSRVNSIQAGKP